MTSNHPIFLSQLNPAQLELLQLFAGGLTDEQLADLKRTLLDFKFKRITSLADQFATDKNWDSDDTAAEAIDSQRRTYNHGQKLESKV